jgi:cytochrome c biogenesis protein CcdA/glutaredoxin
MGAMKKLLIVLLFLLLALPIASAAGSIASSQNTVELYDFYGQGCPHCANLHTFLESIKGNYPSLVVHEKEVYFNKTNQNLMQDMAKAYNTEVKGVPTVFIGNKVFAGFSDAIGQNIEAEIQRCTKEQCISPMERLSGNFTEPTPSITQTLTVGAVVSGAIVDSINPCEFAVLIILLSTILATGTRRKALLAGLAFSLAVFISYYLMGFGLYSAIQISGLAHWFYAVVSVLAIIVGLFNLKDYFWYGKWFVTEVPMKWRPRMKVLLKHVTSVPGAFAIGFLISLFLLPCTSGPYIAILGLLAKTTTRSHALLLLLLYNLIFILPMLIITFSISLGLTTTEKAEHWRTKKLKILHLIAGIIMVIIGIAMIAALLLGYV